MINRFTCCLLLVAAMALSGCEDKPDEAVERLQASRLSFNHGITIGEALNRYNGCEKGSIRWFSSKNDNRVMVNFVCRHTQAEKNLLAVQKIKSMQDYASYFDLNRVDLHITFALSKDLKTVRPDDIAYRFEWKDKKRGEFHYAFADLEPELEKIYRSDLTDFQRLSSDETLFFRTLAAGLWYKRLKDAYSDAK